MNMKTTALVAILVVSAVAMIGAGYAAYTGTTTSDNNVIGEDHLYVMNGIETPVLNPSGKTYTIDYDTVYNYAAAGGSEYTFTVGQMTASVTDGVLTDPAATNTTPQEFITAQTITFDGTPKQTTQIYMKVEFAASPSADSAAFIGTYTGDTKKDPDIKIMAQATTHGTPASTGSAWKDLTTTATYGKYQLLTTTTNTTADLANVLDIHFGAYGSTHNDTATVPTISSGDLIITFLVITDVGESPTIEPTA